MAQQASTSGPGMKILNVVYKGYKDGSIDFLGDQIEAVTGYGRFDFSSKGLKWTDIILEEDRKSSREVFKKALKGDRTYMREYRIRARDGHILWIQEWSQIISDESGEVDYVTGILIDINEHKIAELARLKCEQKTGKYLTFSLAGQEYGISILKVKEIIEVLPITPIPQTPDYVKGVINLRGKVIPVVDLRLKLNLPTNACNERSCIIVAEVSNGSHTLLSGVIVDSVSEVLFIKGADIEDAPQLIAGLNTADSILGMAKIEKSVKIILDIDTVLRDLEIAGLAKAA